MIEKVVHGSLVCIAVVLAILSFYFAYKTIETNNRTIEIHERWKKEFDESSRHKQDGRKPIISGVPQ